MTTWAGRLGWVTYAVITLAFAILPDLIPLPEPQGTVVLDRAVYQPHGGNAADVALPHAIYLRSERNPNSVQYRISFDLQAALDKEFFLLIPMFNRRVSLELNGEHVFDSGAQTLWVGPAATTSILVRIPRETTVVGRNELTATVETGGFAIPTYLSRIYLGSKEALALHYKLRFFVGDQLKTMALAAHLLLGAGLICAYFFRPKDTLFAWFGAFNTVSLIVAISMFLGWQPAFQRILPFFVMLVPATAVLLFGAALALVNIRPPNVLRLMAIGVTCVMLPGAVIDTPLMKMIGAATAALTMTVSCVGATGLLAWSAFRRGNTDARLMLGPLFLMAWFAVRDDYVAATLPDHAFNLLFPYPRPLFLTALTVVLMRRMSISLDLLDRSNETLNIRLADREAELAAFHRQERAKTASMVREQERQRLTHDLHDGLSGHLVSIIALSERAGDHSTEQAAREALNDLRLVIYSLDLGDKELPLALANFRERLIPQLHRLGVELGWSTANLPEVSGVTPGNALILLRVLQEAITNALKHGPARKIVIHGSSAGDGMAAIAVENDGRAFVEAAGGNGLRNMRRRAQQLNGRLEVEALARGTRLTLVFPCALPDFEDDVTVA